MKKIETDFNEKLGKFWLRFSGFVILTNSVLNLKQAQHGSSIHHLEPKISEIATGDLLFWVLVRPNTASDRITLPKD